MDNPARLSFAALTAAFESGCDAAGVVVVEDGHDDVIVVVLVDVDDDDTDDSAVSLALVGVGAALALETEEATASSLRKLLICTFASKASSSCDFSFWDRKVMERMAVPSLSGHTYKIHVRR